MNLRRLWAMARKEAIHIRRDPRSLILAIGIPMLMIVLFGYALTLDVDRVPFVVWDQSQSPLSRDLVARFDASRYFVLHGAVHNQRDFDRAFDERAAMLGLVVPPDFAREIRAGRTAPLQAVVDGSDANTAAMVLGYTRGVVAGFDEAQLREEVRRQGLRELEAPLEVRPRVWFNPDLESKNFIIPGLIAVILGLIAALLTSLTIAREWERGTMEQLVSTPVRPAEVILGKLLPYFVIGLGDVVIAVVTAVCVFKPTHA